VNAQAPARSLPRRDDQDPALDFVISAGNGSRDGHVGTDSVRAAATTTTTTRAQRRARAPSSSSRSDAHAITTTVLGVVEGEVGDGEQVGDDRAVLRIVGHADRCGHCRCGAGVRDP